MESSESSSVLAKDMMTKRPKTGAFWLAAGLLGTVVFAAVVLAVQDDYSRKIHQKESTVKSGNGDVKISLEPNSSPRIESAGSTPAQVPLLVPSTDRQNLQTNAESGKSEHRPNSGRVKTQRMPRSKSMSPARARIFDVKKRLVALWRQSLARKRPDGWALFANSKDHQKKVSYTSSSKN